MAITASYDPALGDPEVDTARSGLAHRKIEAASRLITSATPAAAPFLLLQLADPANGVAPQLEDAVPPEAPAWWAGCTALRAWWRTTLLENSDSALGPTMYRNATRAAKALDAIPDPEREPWFNTVALLVECDLGFSPTQRQRRFDAICARAPDDALAWFSHLRSLGSQRGAEAIDAAAAASPPGSILHALRVVPLIERWREASPEERPQVFQDPRHVQTVHEASDRFLDAPAQTLGLDMWGHSLLAFTTFRTPASRAQAHLEALAGRWTFWPWGLLRNPPAAIEEISAQHMKPKSRLRFGR